VSNPPYFISPRTIASEATAAASNTIKIGTVQGIINVINNSTNGTLDMKLPFGCRPKQLQVSLFMDTIHSIGAVRLIPRGNGLYRSVFDVRVIAGRYGQFNPIFTIHLSISCYSRWRW
jgi:hypothetical protein